MILAQEKLDRRFTPAILAQGKQGRRFTPAIPAQGKLGRRFTPVIPAEGKLDRRVTPVIPTQGKLSRRFTPAVQAGERGRKIAMNSRLSCLGNRKRLSYNSGNRKSRGEAAVEVVKAHRLIMTDKD